MARVRWGLLVPVVTIVLGLLATSLVVGLRAPRPAPVAPATDPAAQEYLTLVLDLMETRSLNKHLVDWPDVRRRALAEVAGARTTADTYPGIALALDALGDPHTFFLDPEQSAELDAELTTPVGEEPGRGPTGRAVGPGIGYVALPATISITGYARGGADLVRALDTARPCGWIVDLRGNTGGAVWPMLDTVAPLLGDGLLGAFVDADGTRADWVLNRGEISIAGEVITRDLPADEATGSPALLDYVTHNAYVLARPNPPVAVLTDGQTASAGEATLIAFRGRSQARSFGEPTAGYATGNAVHYLPDGAQLVLTETAELDRTGRRYDNTPIAPDEPVAAVPGRDAVVEAASAWLRQQPACRA